MRPRTTRFVAVSMLLIGFVSADIVVFARPTDGEQAETPSHIANHTSLQVAPLPFRKINERAAVVIRAIVKELRPSNVGVGKEPDNDIREIELELVAVYRGEGLKAGQRLKIKQFVPMAPVVTKGQEILWFLPAEGSRKLVSPVGILSGAFTLVDDPQHPFRKLAVNGVDNEELCPVDGNWWSEYSIDDARIVVQARKEEFKLNSPVDVVLSGWKHQCGPGAVPLELLVTLTDLKPR